MFRDGDEILIQSRDEKPLNRYFPELLEPLRRRCRSGACSTARSSSPGIAGSISSAAAAHSSGGVAGEASVPADSGVIRLLRSALRGRSGSATASHLRARRRELESLLASAAPPIHVTPATRDRALPSDWFRRFEGAGLDGVMAKPVSGAYEPNKRVMLKVKHERDCDCVVAGFRWHKKGERSASARCCWGSSMTRAGCSTSEFARASRNEKRRELVGIPGALSENALETHPWKAWAEAGAGDGAGNRMPGGQSRWSQGKDLSWEPPAPGTAPYAGSASPACAHTPPRPRAPDAAAPTTNPCPGSSGSARPGIRCPAPSPAPASAQLFHG